MAFIGYERGKRDTKVEDAPELTGSAEVREKGKKTL